LGLLILAAISVVFSGLGFSFLVDSQVSNQVGNIVAVVAIAIWAALGQLERRFYQGRAIPPRNL
jgi:hypothetical protein